MRNRFRNGLAALLIAGAVPTLCDAVKRNPPIPADPKLMAVESLYVLPIVDARAGDKANVNLEKLRSAAAGLMKKKRYAPSLPTASEGAPRIAEEDLQAATPSFVKKLGPEESRWIMVLCLRDVHSKITFGSTGNAEISGYLFDKQTGELIWSGKGQGQAGQGGLMGMAMKGAMNGAALQTAVANLLGPIPSRPKPGK